MNEPQRATEPSERDRDRVIATKVIDAYEAALGSETSPYEAGAIALREALAQHAQPEQEELRRALEQIEKLTCGGKGESAVHIIAANALKVSKRIPTMELRRVIAECIADLENIVCVKEPDDGVVLLSNDGPCHWDEELKVQVYDHEHFSPLGDALIALHQRLTAALTPKGPTP